ncbi:MAG: hypothetical protein J0I79_28570 [Mesorhizobium sp.]|uniref:hypothetical protein n=1 Tax=Mesorhizobium sp. TaxID=1871066 RepID=UPI001ACAD4AE|nr:hypothetical protein [Mesorhizobium sp.]MBN9221915.1 hypothetical protein [Mesorhizobium sp.]
MFDKTQHSQNSSLRENIIEHQFIGAALRVLWSHGIVDAEILRSEFDGYGYDLVLSRGHVVRHIQLKSGLRLKNISISSTLMDRPSGCVIFVEVDDDLEVKRYHFFGGTAGSALPDISSLKTTHRLGRNKSGERPLRVMHRDLPKSKFQAVASLTDLLELLFGHKPEFAT